MKRNILMGIFALIFFTAQIHAQTISAVQARELALAVTGGGTVSSLELLTDPAIGPVYHIVVIYNDLRHEVSINAVTAEVFRLTAVQAAEAEPTTARAPEPARHVTRQGIDLTALGITPASPPRFSLFRPRNPPVSRANAVEIGYQFLASRGFPHATFRRHDGVERDYGRWAWELYFLDGWTEIELYVDMHSGEVVRFDIDR